MAAIQETQTAQGLKVDELANRLAVLEQQKMPRRLFGRN
jgi:hypothetical protein